jgi:hypothetical protein
MKLMIFSLCNNDFGYSMKTAVEFALNEGLHDSAGEDCVQWKDVVIRIMCALNQISWWKSEDAMNSTEKYLRDGLQVYVTDKFPTYDGIQPMDHDGGSVMLDLESGFVSTF